MTKLTPEQMEKMDSMDSRPLANRTSIERPDWLKKMVAAKASRKPYPQAAE